MVLPDRIELSTSPLPMECSTTELRQHAREARIGPKGPDRRAVLATRTPLAQARGRVIQAAKTAKISSAPPRIRFAPCVLSAFPVGSAEAGECPPAYRLLDRAVQVLSSIRLSSTSRHSNGSGMKDDQDKRERQVGVGARDSRQDRLKLALRENLKRRKSQARGRSDPATVIFRTRGRRTR